MGSKSQPGAFDCYANAEQDEPMFILLARDRDAADLVDIWADARAHLIAVGLKPESDRAMVAEARECANAMREWRLKNRKPGHQHHGGEMSNNQETWFVEYRLAWIKESVEIFGQINRDNIMQKFRISLPQASYDIQQALERWPDLMAYNRSTKRYERTELFI